MKQRCFQWVPFCGGPQFEPEASCKATSRDLPIPGLSPGSPVAGIGSLSWARKKGDEERVSRALFCTSLSCPEEVFYPSQATSARAQGGRCLRPRRVPRNFIGPLRGSAGYGERRESAPKAVPGPARQSPGRQYPGDHQNSTNEQTGEAPGGSA